MTSDEAMDLLFDLFKNNPKKMIAFGAKFTQTSKTMTMKLTKGTEAYAAFSRGVASTLNSKDKKTMAALRKAAKGKGH